MLPSVAKLCARNGTTISVRVAKFRSPAVNKVAFTRYLTSPPVLMFFLPPASRKPNVRWVSLSGLSRRHEEPLDLPSSPDENENFGSFSTHISARRTFKKSSPEMLDFRYREDEDQKLEKPVRKPVRRNTTYWYFLQCKKLIKEGKEALDMFSRDMLQTERLQPEEYNFSVLIGGCGRAGHLKKAFKLYNDMKKRGLEASDATYTALFNACAESPHKQAGLQQALKLEQELRRKRYALSTITYHALLKTHALCNHLQACMHTLREMLQNGHTATQETFHYLLMGCLKDKDIGFRLALQVWRQMLKAGILPDSNNYTLLLRTARDCGLGDPALASSILLRSHVEECESRVKSSKAPIDVDLLERELFVQPDLHGGGERSNDTQDSLVPCRPNETGLLPFSSAPNLLDLLEGNWGGSISFGSVGGPADRLALLGGGEGLLGKMAENGLKPDLRTLTLLADTMAPGVQSLQTLLKVAKQHRIKLDTAFYNSAIRRAARTGDLDGAKAVLSVMRKYNVSVDVQTFGSLAMGCQRYKDGLQLLKDMEEAGLRPNVHVFSALIGQASRRLDYIYLKTLLKSMCHMGVLPNEVIVKQLEFAAQYPPNYNQYKSRNNYLVQIDGFRGYYQQWLRVMPAQGDQDQRAELQPDSKPVAEVKTGAGALGGLIEAPNNQRAVASRRHPRMSSMKPAI
ncbi:pentatricopeptide repeat-containing protein 1, mitochondrial isoform X2 [Dunckerocampus dactyliophorus]|uniref:pentatricopeptide repeat-containing protein 1, mitochondrial isoform X2 n=1 Tax=Dunckerocampus dactyliophorus TaxID=161453 RepID=UPI0024057553|nr:pentatricopeptide repeat-containing protein 1, mitochondrial isoform X2 [Dunckerocampus dactyliophorus]